MQCGAVLGSGGQCRRGAEVEGGLCAYHRSIAFRRAARAFHLARLSAEDQEALGPAARVEGVDAEIAWLRVLLRQAAGNGNFEAFRRGIESLSRALATRRQIGARATPGLWALLEAHSGTKEPAADDGPRPERDPKSHRRRRATHEPPWLKAERELWGPLNLSLAKGAPALEGVAAPLTLSLSKGIPVPDREMEAAALVLRYQRGEPAALDLLHGLLEVTILGVLLHYRALQAPSALAWDDLQGQSRGLLAQLAQRWRPGVSFLAYFYRGFPAAVDRYVRRAQPGTRSGAAGAHGEPVEPSAAADEADATSPASPTGGPEGPFSAPDLASLPELERQIVLLRAFAGQDMQGIARQVGLPTGTAFKLYQRARARLQGRTQPPGGRASAALRRLVTALHAAAGPDGRLPSRDWAMAAAGLMRREYDDLMARLEGAQAIHGRGPRRVAGYLVERDAAATLARLGDRGPVSA